MIKLLSVILIVNVLMLEVQTPQQFIKLGNYGAYASWDLYTELRLLDSNKFIYSHIAPNTPPIRNLTGTWVFNKGHLRLSGKFDKRFVAVEYELKGDSVLCPTTPVNHITCLKYGEVD